MNIKDNFTLRTVRKKIIMVSKTAGIVLIISYVVSTRLPIHPDVSFWIWLCFVTALVLVVDYLMGRFISKEFDALHLLIVNRKRVLTFETIAYHVWGEEYIDVTPKAIHNLLSRLRQKLQIAPEAPEYVISVRGVGYKFDIPHTEK